MAGGKARWNIPEAGNGPRSLSPQATPRVPARLPPPPPSPPGVVQARSATAPQRVGPPAPAYSRAPAPPSAPVVQAKRHPVPPHAPPPPRPAAPVIQRMERENVPEDLIKFGKFMNRFGVGTKTAGYMQPIFYEKEDIYGNRRMVPMSYEKKSVNTHGYVFYRTIKTGTPKIAFISQRPISGVDTGEAFSHLVEQNNDRMSTGYKPKTKLLPGVQQTHVHAEMNYLCGKMIEKDFDWSKIVAFFRFKAPSFVTFNADESEKSTCDCCAAAFKVFNSRFVPHYVYKSRRAYDNWEFPTQVIQLAFNQRHAALEEQCRSAALAREEAVARAKKILEEIHQWQEADPRASDLDSVNSYLNMVMVTFIIPNTGMSYSHGVPIINQVIHGCNAIKRATRSSAEEECERQLAKLADFKQNFNIYIGQLNLGISPARAEPLR